MNSYHTTCLSFHGIHLHAKSEGEGGMKYVVCEECVYVGGIDEERGRWREGIRMRQASEELIGGGEREESEGGETRRLNATCPKYPSLSPTALGPIVREL